LFSGVKNESTKVIDKSDYNEPKGHFKRKRYIVAFFYSGAAYFPRQLH
jgi:hypothetical protein